MGTTTQDRTASTTSQKQQKQQQQQQSAATPNAELKNQLRGLSYDEGAKVLNPDAQQQPGADKKSTEKKKSKSGLPPEIEALRLRKVTVECSEEAWAALDDTERAAVLTFLVKKEALCKKSKRLKSSKVTIGMGGTIENATEEQKSEADKTVEKNKEELNKGRAPNADNTIGVKEGDVHVTKTETKKIKEEPEKETKKLDATFDASGSTFDSADYKPEDMQQSGVMTLLDQAAEKIKEYLALDPNAKVTFKIVASESHVTNPKGFETPGSLAEARATNGIELAKAHFKAMGIDESHLVFTKDNLGANGPKWDPKAGISKHDPMYTMHQFVRVEVSAEVEVDSEESETEEETPPTETKTQDIKLVKMNVADDRKPMKRSKQKKTRTKKTKRSKKPRKYRTVNCPVF